MKKHIKLLLRTLFSNSACVEAARSEETPYQYIGIIFVLFALFFAAMPTCVTGFQQQGGAWVSGATFNLDTSLRKFATDTDGGKDPVKLFTINDHKLVVSSNWEKSYNTVTTLVLDKDGKQEKNKGYPISTPRYVYRDAIAQTDTSVTDWLEVYAFPDDDENALFKKVERLLANLNPDENAPDEKLFLKKQYVEAEGKYKPCARNTSLMVFGKDCFYFYLFSAAAPGAAQSSLYGDYHHMDNNLDIIQSIAGTSKPEDIIKNLKDFSNLAFLDTRWNNTWKSTGIILGVDVGVVLLMGLLVWVLTRGKNNPFRIYSLWDGQKIAYYASLTPGLLALFGFLIPNMAMMLFVLGTGVRVMWLNMRTLRYQAPAK